MKKDTTKKATAKGNAQAPAPEKRVQFDSQKQTVKTVPAPATESGTSTRRSGGPVRHDRRQNYFGDNELGGGIVYPCYGRHYNSSLNRNNRPSHHHRRHNKVNGRKDANEMVPEGHSSSAGRLSMPLRSDELTVESTASEDGGVC